MKPNLAITAENISKQYRLGEVGTGTITHDLNRFWAKILGKEDPFLKIGEANDRSAKGGSEYVWSLQDINFEIEKGDAVGIIGRNGAGKSTLLKLLSRVTKPTTGHFEVQGRIASLLEVGTGFNPEMTGRENIFLNGAILGMRKQEIKKKFDEIVDFAGVERYIDTPVKRYSSGMYVRLAFAVAAHLESEILIVDEVLAVGDAEFQKKCLGKMGDVSKGEGRTVLFVSHNMGAVNQLCKKGIYLKQGNLVSIDTSNKIIDEYLKDDSKANSKYVGSDFSTKAVWFKQIDLIDANHENKKEFFHDEKVIIRYFLGFNTSNNRDYSIFCTILDRNQNRIFSTESEIVSSDEIFLIINPVTLVRGSYSIHTFIHKPRTEQIDIAENVCHFSIIDNGSSFNIHGDYNYGSVFGNTNWDTKLIRNQ